MILVIIAENIYSCLKKCTDAADRTDGTVSVCCVFFLKIN